MSSKNLTKAAPEGPSPSAPLTCAPLDARVPPQFVVFLRRHVSISRTVINSMQGEDMSLNIACVRVPSTNGQYLIGFSRGFDLGFAQTWSLNRLAIGDVSSTIALAPSEQLTLEFQVTQRRVLEQTTLDTAEAQDQIESTTIDKEVMNVTRSASRNHSWHIDGNGSFSLGPVTPSVSAGVSDSLTQTSQASMEHMTEATQKSSHSLKTLHKVEVHGVTEGAVSNRMTRVIKNPYSDRTLSLNVSQLIKQFTVETKVSEVRPAIIIDVSNLIFDEGFVTSNGAFLRDNLLDVDLADGLQSAVQASTPIPSAASNAARDIARTALRFLFDEQNIFNVPPVPPRYFGVGLPPPPDFSGIDANDPANSFNVKDVDPRVSYEKDDSLQGNQSGLTDSLRGHGRGAVGLAHVFTTLNFFYRVYRTMVIDGRIEENAISMASAIETAVGQQWQTLMNDASAKVYMREILDANDFTEALRRLSGFLAMVSGMLRPLVAPAGEEEKISAEHARGRLVLRQLIHHLDCNKNFYIQQFLAYTARRTANQAIVDFVKQVIAKLGITEAERDAIATKFDIERAFIDRQQVVVPSFHVATPVDLGLETSWTAPPAQVTNVDVPSDGIHMEVVPGMCVLDQLPDPHTELNLSVKDVNIHFVGH